MASAEGLKEVGYFDCAGGGQIRVDGTTAYIGHMANPFGTSIVDVDEMRFYTDVLSADEIKALSYTGHDGRGVIAVGAEDLSARFIPRFLTRCLGHACMGGHACHGDLSLV